MKKLSLLLIAALMAVPLTTSAESGTKGSGEKSTSPTKSSSEMPKSSPGWVVIEEDFWTPLRFEPLFSLDAIRYHYRRDQERAAADEIDKAVSWLRLAAGHALPITKEDLNSARTDLEKLSEDLRAGKIFDAALLDYSLAKAAHALSDWHFYRAKESWGKNETQDAGKNLELAAQYLQHAANSAHYQFGPDTEKFVTATYHNGKKTGETVTYDHNRLGQHLQEVEKALKELSTVMKKK